MVELISKSKPFLVQLQMNPPTMKDYLSLQLLKNSFGLKMKKGFRSFCNGEASTSILDKAEPIERQPTLEEMILQLEMEEKMSRRSKNMEAHRMSCVSSCEILRSARKALNQYPRFSLDGKDAMYRSSFTGEMEAERLPALVGGESVIWCKPGVVGRLMGLDAMPIPLNTSYRRERLNAMIRRQNLQRGRRVVAEGRTRGVVGSCSRAVELEIPNGEGGWPPSRFRL